MSARINPPDFQGQAEAFNLEGWINAPEAAARIRNRAADMQKQLDAAAAIQE